jgi:ribosome maturation factor RimP
MSISPTLLQGIERDALDQIVEPIVRAHGAEVVDVEYKPDRGAWVLRVFVEKAGASELNLSTKDAAVTLELCANISRDLSPALDIVDLIPNAYHLEVSSPGIERPLRGERDFSRFAGQKAKLRLRSPANGQRVVVGILQGVVDGKVRVMQGLQSCEVSLASIESSRLVFELTSHPKAVGSPRQSGSRDHKQSKH